MAHWLFLPNDAIDDLETLSRLSREQLSKLRDFLDSSEFRPRYSFYVKVADLLQMSDEGAAKICNFVNYVQVQRTRNKQAASTIPEQLEHFLKKSIEDSKIGSKADKLLKYVKDNGDLLAGLFSDLPEYDFSSKVRGLESGPLPHLKDFRAYCDLRPVYNAEGSEIVLCIPVITINLVTHSAESDETTETIVQLTEENVAELKQQIERLDKKLAKLKESFAPFLNSNQRRGGK